MTAGVIACVGLNGGGKSAAAAELVALPMMRQGYPVVSNARLYPARLGMSNELFVPLREPGQLTRVGVHFDRTCGDCGAVNQHCDCVSEPVKTPKLDPDTGELWSITGNRPCAVWIDEATSALPARQSLDMPAEVQRQIDQFRKLKARVVITAPNYMKIDKLLRGVVQVVVFCEGARPDRWVRDDDWRVVRGPDGKRLRQEPGWEPNRVLFWNAYRALDFEEDQINPARLERAEPVWARRVKVKRLAARRLYDTSENVGLLDHLDAAGNCANCGGYKRRAQCSCERERGARPARVRA